jgi:hypothetical protein
MKTLLDQMNESTNDQNESNQHKTTIIQILNYTPHTVNLMKARSSKMLQFVCSLPPTYQYPITSKEHHNLGRVTNA